MSGKSLLDVRVVLRQISRSPMFALVSLALVGIALGPCLAMLAVVESIDLAPLPFAESQNLVDVRETAAANDPACPSCALPTSFRTFTDWRDQLHSVRSLAAYAPRTRAVWEHHDGSTVVWLTEVSGEFFAALGVPPLLGRVIEGRDVREGADAPVLLSYSVWNSDFARDPSVVGRSLQLDPSRGRSSTFTVIGVMPEHFLYPMNTAMWIPVAPDASASRGEREYAVLGRLRPGATLQQADAELAVVQDRLTTEDPILLRGFGAQVVPLHQRVAALASSSRFLLLLVAVVLLGATCANLLGLFVARAATRRGDAGVRLALGARRRDVVRPLLIEILMVGSAGLVVALAIAHWMLRLIGVLLRVDFAGVTIDLTWRVAVVGALMAAVMAVVLGVVTSGETLRGATSLHLGSGRVAGTRRRIGAAALCSLQVALALVLVVGGVALSREFLRLRFDAAGYDPVGLTYVDLGSVAAHARRDNLSEFAERARTIPGVNDVAVFSRSSELAVPLEPLPSGVNPRLQYVRVSANFFTTLGMRLSSGRSISAHGEAPAAEVVVNQSAARALWPDAAALGKVLKITDEDRRQSRLVTVVGVLRDARLLTPLRGAAQLVVYDVTSNAEMVAPIVYVRSRNSGGELRAALRQLLVNVFGPSESASLSAVSLSDGLREETRGLRVMVGTTGGFALVTLILAAVGLYGLVAYSLSEKVREIGVRIALGASATRIMLLAASEGAFILLAGTVVGMIGSLSLEPILESLVGGRARLDPFVFAMSVAVLLVATIAAIVVPGRRALRTDPARALQMP